MSTNETDEITNIDDQLEPFPTDGEVRDHEAAAEEMGLSYWSAFRIGDDVFGYRGIDLGEAIVDRLSEPELNSSQRIPMTELWEAYQRGTLEIGTWQCQFVPEGESGGNNE